MMLRNFLTDFFVKANNFLGELKGKNFVDGWVEDSKDAIDSPPGFFQNLLSGGEYKFKHFILTVKCNTQI